MKSKKQPVEYRLLIQPTFDETVKKDGILFLLETSKQFTNFAYVIDVKEEFEGKNIHWSLHGLRAPSMNMPTTGTARFHKIYFNLPKNIVFELTKKDTKKINAEIKFLKNSIKVENIQIGFLKIYTNSQQFDDERLNDSEVAELKPDIHRKPIHPKLLLKKKTKK